MLTTFWLLGIIHRKNSLFANCDVTRMVTIDLILYAFGVGMFAILLSSYIVRWILKRDQGSARMKEVSSYIIIGTSAYPTRAKHYP